MILSQSMPKKSVSINSITTDKFKTGTLVFSIRVPNQKLLSPYALLLTEVLQRATASYPTKASLQKRLDELYSATVSIKCAKHEKNKSFTFSAEILDNEYIQDKTDVVGEICKLLYELIFCPLLDDDGFFPEISVEQEKRRTVNYLRSIINNPSRYASIRLSELLRRDDENLMTLEDMIVAVESCDRYKLTQFYKETLVCRPVDVFYIGTLREDEITERVMSCLAFHTPSKQSSSIALESPYKEREICRKEENMPLSQGRLAIGFTSDVCLNSEDFYAVYLFNELFGGGPSSKLFMNVREKMSLCYSCASYYNMSTGSIRVSAGIAPENRDIAEKAILEEFENIKKGKISDREFLSAKKTIENSYREIYDNPSDVLAFYSGRLALGINCTIEECRQKFEKLTKEDVMRVAKKIRLDAIYFLCGDGQAEYEEEDDE